MSFELADVLCVHSKEHHELMIHVVHSIASSADVSATIQELYTACERGTIRLGAQGQVWFVPVSDAANAPEELCQYYKGVVDQSINRYLELQEEELSFFKVCNYLCAGSVR